MKSQAKPTKKPSKLTAIKNAILGSGASSKKKAAPPSKPAAKTPVSAKPAPAKAGAKKAAPVAAPAPKAGKANGAAKGKAPAAEAVVAVVATKAAKGKGKSSAVSYSASSRATDEVCREVACEGLATSAGYCRMHYIKNWKKIKRKELILKEKKLNQYIEELVAKYPDKYIEAIRQDLANDKDFAQVIIDLDLDESVDDFDMENESVDSLVDNIKRDFEDEGEGF